MGNAESTGDQHHDQDDEFAEFDGIETLGYRVLGVQPNSPASSAGLVSFFDFLVGANGQMLLGSGEGLEEGEEYDDIDFPSMLQANKGQAIELLVWNIKSQEQRFVDLTPDDNWGGAGLLGVTIRLDNYGGADERLIRVLEVENNSPASQAGLVPLKDYLLGTTAIAFGSTKQLAEVLDAHLDHFVEIYVYNSDSDKVRVISLQPTFSWGGRGMLGAEVGTGYLHRLPKSCRSTVGQSVERKVRLTSKNIATTSVDDTTTTPSEKGGGGTTESAATTSASSNGENSSSQVLEVEPHLEMEVEKDSQGNLNINPEDLTKQPHQLGTSEEEETTTNGHQQQQTGGKQDSSSSETLDDKLDQQSAPSSKTMFSAASTPPSQQKLQHQNYDASDSSLAVQVPQSRIAASPSSLPDPPISTTTDETAAGMPNNNAFSDLPPPPKMAY